MINLDLNSIVRYIKGRRLFGPSDRYIEDVVTSVRKLKPGYLLFNTSREDIDYDSLCSSCSVVTDKFDEIKCKRSDVSIICVTDIQKAFFSFVDFYRCIVKVPVIGVTGTCGKTTTKEMIAYLLSNNGSVASTYKSCNNASQHLKYLLSIDKMTKAAVFEMGVAVRDDLIRSSMYFKPNIGVITNIGVDHCNNFSAEEYLNEKAKLVECLDSKSTLILNTDDENIKKISLKGYRGKVVYFGYNEKADFRIDGVFNCDEGLEFTLIHQGKEYEVYLPMYCSFNAYNAAAAIAAASCAGMNITDAVKRIAFFVNVERHFEIVEGINGSVVIDDTWSTNPTSADAAIDNFMKYGKGKKTIAVLGRMSLLGKESDKYHYQLGKKVAQSGVDILCVLGEGVSHILSGAIENGMDNDKIYCFKNSDDIYEFLKDTLCDNTVVLVKTTMIASYSDLLDRLIVARERKGLRLSPKRCKHRREH